MSDTGAKNAIPAFKNKMSIFPYKETAASTDFLSNCATELSNTEPQIHEFLAENQKSVVNTFEKLIIEAQEVGEIDQSKDANILAQYLFSSLQGLRITAMVDTDKKHIKGIVDQVLSTL